MSKLFEGLKESITDAGKFLLGEESLGGNRWSESENCRSLGTRGSVVKTRCPDTAIDRS